MLAGQRFHGVGPGADVGRVHPMTSIDVGAWKNLVVVCAGNRYDGIKVADQHMAEHLAQLVPVLYVDPPVSLLTVFRNPEIASSLEASRLQVIGPRLARLTPVVQPFHTRRGMA